MSKTIENWFVFGLWLIGRILFIGGAVITAPIWIFCFAIIFACSDIAYEDVAPWKRRP
ncbi:MAG TPA: hypothetical protein VIT62_14495 [Lysobacter sp.]